MNNVHKKSIHTIGKKKKYEKPKICSIEPLEIVAVACSPGKAPPSVDVPCLTRPNS